MENNSNPNGVSRITAGTSFKGEIISAGDIRIDGNFDGRIVSKGRLVVGENADIKGDFFCQDVDFSGKLEGGVIVAKNLLFLKPGSSIQNGNLSFKLLQVEPEAILNGTCHVLKDGEFEKLAGMPEGKPAPAPAPAPAPEKIEKDVQKE